MEVVGKDETAETIEDKSYVNEVKLQKYASNVYGLKRNGSAMRCPIIPALVIQYVAEPLSGIASMNTSQPKVETREVPKTCNSTCPLFQMRTKADGGLAITLGCGGGHTEHEIKEILPFLKKTK